MSDSGRLSAIVDLLAEEITERVLARVAAQASAQPDGYVGTDEAARIADVEQATVRTWIQGKRLLAVKLEGVRGWKIKRSDLERFLAGAQAGSAGVLPPVDLAGERAKRLAASIQRKRGDS